jgi:hypothetical protein
MPAKVGCMAVPPCVCAAPHTPWMSTAVYTGTTVYNHCAGRSTLLLHTNHTAPHHPYSLTLYMLPLLPSLNFVPAGPGPPDDGWPGCAAPVCVARACLLLSGLPPGINTEGVKAACKAAEVWLTGPGRACATFQSAM